MAGQHHRGDFHSRSKRIRAAANADPTTLCWRCGRTLAQCPPHKNGSPARWTAGHLIDGDMTSPLMAECSPRNFVAGARLAHSDGINSTLNW